ncbi:MAG: ABC transporter ATP-binding protein [Chitinophagales bacterium]|nr:ABC transporter ATP-binding protein [Hyphomicrobiales bacterium]
MQSASNTNLAQFPREPQPVFPLRAERITKQYNDGAFSALDDVSFELRENEITAFVGPSGCGKTTMLRIIAGLEYPTCGRLEIFGRRVVGPGPDRGMIFQSYTSFPWLTVLQNVEYGMKIMGVPPEARRERAMSFLKLVHLDKFLNSYPKSLSGGMKQRVALARTLAQNPKVLLMDEPFGALDAQVRWEMQELMVELIEKEKKTVVAVTHDIAEAIYLADRIIFFTKQPGRIKADFRVDFKGGRRYQRKEELIKLPGYADLEHRLFAMMREEIQRAT